MLEKISFYEPLRNSRSQFAGICFVKEYEKEFDETTKFLVPTHARILKEVGGVSRIPLSLGKFKFLKFT